MTKHQAKNKYLEAQLHSQEFHVQFVRSLEIKRQIHGSDP